MPRLRWSSLAARALTILVPAALLVALGWADGGYYPRAWGALLVAAGVVLAAAALLGGEVELDRRRAVFAGGLVALAAWSLVSRAWAVAPDGAVLEAERTLAYAGLAGAALLAVPRRRLDELLVGVLAGVGVVSAGGLVRYALGAAAVERLELPIGYANAAGIVACVAILLGLGLRRGPAARRALGAAVCPPAAVVLLLSLSRGAMLAGALGGVLLLATSRASGGWRRAAPVALASLVAALLVEWAEPFAAPGRSSGEVAWLVVVGALATAAAAAAVLQPGRARRSFAGARRRPWRSPPRSRRWSRSASRASSPSATTARCPPPTRAHPPASSRRRRATGRTTGPSRRARWATGRCSGSARAGSSAAGSASATRRSSSAMRTTSTSRRSPSSGRSAWPCSSPSSSSRSPARGRIAASGAGRAALAAYAALLAHAALDWDWELPVGRSARSCSRSCSSVSDGRPRPRDPAPPSGRRPRRRRGLSSRWASTCASLPTRRSARTRRSTAATRRAARSSAREVRRLTPWAAEPWRLLGEAEVAAGRLESGRAHLRRATREDPDAAGAWLALAFATDGAERRAALVRVRELDPLAPELGVFGADDPSKG